MLQSIERKGIKLVLFTDADVADHKRIATGLQATHSRDFQRACHEYFSKSREDQAAIRELLS